MISQQLGNRYGATAAQLAPGGWPISQIIQMDKSAKRDADDIGQSWLLQMYRVADFFYSNKKSVPVHTI